MWFEYLRNNIFICSLYKSVPDLVDVEIGSIQAIDGNPSIRIAIHLPRFADYPPKKWDPLCEIVCLTLVFNGCDDLFWKGWSEVNIGTISIEKSISDRFSIRVRANKMEMSSHPRAAGSPCTSGT